jgi:hypothetical protein
MEVAPPDSKTRGGGVQRRGVLAALVPVPAHAGPVQHQQGQPARGWRRVRPDYPASMAPKLVGFGTTWGKTAICSFVQMLPSLKQ